MRKLRMESICTFLERNTIMLELIRRKFWNSFAFCIISCCSVLLGMRNSTVGSSATTSTGKIFWFAKIKAGASGVIGVSVSISRTLSSWVSMAVRTEPATSR